MKKEIKILSIILTTIIFYLLLQGCSEDSPTKPEGNNVPALSSKTIDNNGGTIKTDNIEIYIPPGAFQTGHEIKILNSSEDNLFSTNAASDFFVVDGLPPEFAAPIKIKIKYKGTLSDSSFVAIGENNFISSLNEETISYHLISAKDSAGFLIAEIPPINNQSLGKSLVNSSVNEDKLSINLGAIAGYVSYLSSKKHFNINTPSSVLTQAYDLADYLESAYLKIQGIGFKYSKRTRWPIEVTVKRFKKPDVYGYTSASIWGNNYGYLEFNFDKMDESDNMKVTAGHEFFHLVQDLYDPRSGYSKRRTPMPNFWLNEASSVWSEALFIGNSNYVSSVFELNAFDILKGAKTGDTDPNDGTVTQDYGYGMSSLIKYITNKYGVGKLAEIYNKISEGKTPFQAVSSVLPINVGFTWHSFLKSLFSFDIYKSDNFRPALLSSYATGEHQKFTIKNASDSLATYKSKLSDCSATIFSVENQFKEMSSNAMLQFTCKDWKFQIYKYNSSSSELIGAGKDTLTVENYKKLTDDGYRIAAVLYNDDYDSPFEHSKDYQMEIRVLAPQTISWVDFYVEYTGTFEYSDSDTTYTFTNDATIGEFVRNVSSVINGNSITISQDSTDSYYQRSTKIQLTFDDINNPTNIVDFAFDQTENGTYNTKEISSVVGSNVSFSTEKYGNTGTRYIYTGDISQYLSKLSFLRQQTIYDNSVTSTELKSYESQGKIQIIVEYK